MIDPKELRIGNTVKWEIPNRNAKTITVDSIGGDVDFDAMHAIPLNPEILHTFGFKTMWVGNNKNALVLKFPDTNGGISVEYGSMFIVPDYDDPAYCLKVDALSVHKFQSLYFALTGIELNYTP